MKQVIGNLHSGSLHLPCTEDEYNSYMHMTSPLHLGKEGNFGGIAGPTTNSASGQHTDCELLC